MPPIYAFLDPGQTLPGVEIPLLPVRRSYVLGYQGRLFLSREDLPAEAEAGDPSAALRPRNTPNCAVLPRRGTGKGSAKNCGNCA